MPKKWIKIEGKLRKQAKAKKKGGTLEGTIDAYVFGTMRKMGWKKRKK